MSAVKKEWRDLNGVSLERKTYPEGSYYFVNGANINREVGCALWEAAAPAPPCREDARLQLIRQWKEDNHKLAFPVAADAWKELDRILNTQNPSASPCRESGETVGAWLRRVRIEGGYSLREVAAALGISVVKLGEVERNAAQPPDSAPEEQDEGRTPDQSWIVALHNLRICADELNRIGHVGEARMIEDAVVRIVAFRQHIAAR